MKNFQKLLIVAFTLTLSVQSSYAQTVKFVTIDSTSASFRNPDAIADRKAKALAGMEDLKKANPEFMKALNEAAKDKDFKLAEIKYYTAEYIQIPFEQYRKLLYDISGDWADNTYGDMAYTKKACVLRKTTAEEKAKRVEAVRASYASKSSSPIATNNVELSKLVGQPAPDFTVTTLDGKQVSLSSLKGKVVVMNFWFTMCRPCVEEIPTLNKFVEKYKDRKDIVFLAPECANATNEDVQKFLKRAPFSYQIALGGKDVAMKQYQSKVFPANFLIDKNGIVRNGYVGLNPVALDDYGKMIPKLLEEAPAKGASKK
ncbi:TlpA family protein disulfide reductase [Solitalea koreensis]|uniref:Thiol-disulfide isomerase or thioredoxin n=1 Tax=Solitalea koreensis TaxID=543615 RepID=A0A521C4Y8_9SPHI|nr:TlpA disulfide reductase family protein [Solitalea koreensis]SMO53750.1 Thiol-disulfide isomerase or thioredoxin [Solitalea koreensis]